uniref:hAT-like transposase RNase-H fold domain-containing protein n=1 Tax=Oryza rufipogon TaxID=4529 RepID=A0A0E0R8N1_ORYRU
MEEKFLKYYTAIPHLCCFALVLDPRKKLEVMVAAFISIGDAMGLDYSEAYQHIRDKLFRVFCLYQTKLSVTLGCLRKPHKKKQTKSSVMNLWKKIRGKEQASLLGSTVAVERERTHSSCASSLCTRTFYWFWLPLSLRAAVRCGGGGG